MGKEFCEPILSDDYPVYCSYFYIADGTVVQSPVEGEVRDLKRALKAHVIRRCDAVARALL
jgi:hypothetical protein